jgi:hypothetical protein
MMKKMVVAVLLAIIAVAVAWYVGQELKKGGILNDKMSRIVPE